MKVTCRMCQLEGEVPMSDADFEQLQNKIKAEHGEEMKQAIVCHPCFKKAMLAKLLDDITDLGDLEVVPEMRGVVDLGGSSTPRPSRPNPDASKPDSRLH